MVIDALAALLSEFPELHYDVVGTGPEEKRLRNKVKRLGLDARVSFYGYIPNGELPNLYQKCDLFVMPSLDEGFGIVYLEALAMGRPVIGCKGQGLEDFVDEEVGILIAPGDRGALVDAIRRSLRTKWDQESLIRRAREWTWDRMSDGLVDVYNEVLEMHCKLAR